MRRRWLAGSLLLALPAGGCVLGHAAADAMGSRIAGSAAHLAALVLARAPQDPQPSTPLAPSESAAATPGRRGEAPVEARAPQQPRPGRSPTERDPRQDRARGVSIPAAAVLRLANSGIVPAAVPVEPSGDRPAGLRLVSVSELGLGMRDGDVITRVLGAPVRSTGEVAELVLRARARGVRLISGEFWRGGRRFTLTVEQPYLGGGPSPAEARLTQAMRGPKLLRP